MKITFKKFTHLVIYYLIPLLLIYLSYISPAPTFFASLGRYTFYLLLIILFSKPLAVLTGGKFFWKIVSYRRELGVLSFWTFIFHAAGLTYSYQLYRFASWPVAVYWGAAAGIGMLILGLTSNKYAVRLLRRNWKRLHRIVYFVFFAALIHIALTRQEYLLYPIIFLLYFGLKILEWTKIKKMLKKPTKTL